MEKPRAEEDRIPIAADYIERVGKEEGRGPGWQIRRVERFLADLHRHFLVDIKQVDDLAVISVVCKTPEGKVVIDDFARMLVATSPSDHPRHARVGEVMQATTGTVEPPPPGHA